MMGRAMDDRIRISDADRDGIAARLREHFADGRLTADELDERLTAALSAKTYGDLRRVMADLPEPGLSRIPNQQPFMPRPVTVMRYRRPRIFPLVLIALLAAALISGSGWVLAVVFKAVLVAWLIACLFGLLAAARFGRRLRRNGQAHGGYGYHSGHDWRGRHGRHWR